MQDTKEPMRLTGTPNYLQTLVGGVLVIVMGGVLINGATTYSMVGSDHDAIARIEAKQETDSRTLNQLAIDMATLKGAQERKP